MRLDSEMGQRTMSDLAEDDVRGRIVFGLADAVCAALMSEHSSPENDVLAWDDDGSGDLAYIMAHIAGCCLRHIATINPEAFSADLIERLPGLLPMALARSVEDNVNDVRRMATTINVADVDGMIDTAIIAVVAAYQIRMANVAHSPDG